MPEKPRFLALSAAAAVGGLSLALASLGYGASAPLRKAKPLNYESSPYKSYKAFPAVPYCFDASGAEAQPIDCVPRPKKKSGRGGLTARHKPAAGPGEAFKVPQLPKSYAQTRDKAAKNAMIGKILRMMKKKSRQSGGGGAGKPSGPQGAAPQSAQQ